MALTLSHTDIIYVDKVILYRLKNNIILLNIYYNLVNRSTIDEIKKMIKYLQLEYSSLLHCFDDKSIGINISISKSLLYHEDFSVR